MSERKSGVVDGEHEFSLISNETLLQLYRGLLGGRVLLGRKSAWAFDAAAVAVAQDLVAEDAVIADVPVTTTLNGRGHGSGAQVFAHELERAVGSALAQKTKKTGKVTVVFGGADHGQAWTDALEIARAHRLPMIFVAESREEETPARRGGRKAKASELEPGTEMARIIVDGHDVVASYRVAHEAIDRARSGRGVTLIACTVFRVAGRRRQDAVAGMESYLRGKGLLPRGTKQEMLEAIAREGNTRKR
jgi:Dehydrogenase E1 component